MKLLGKLKLNSYPDIECGEVVFSKSKSYILEKPSTSIGTNDRKAYSDKINTKADCDNRLENKTEAYRISSCSRSRKHGTSMVKQPQLVLITFDEKRRYIIKYEGVVEFGAELTWEGGGRPYVLR